MKDSSLSAKDSLVKNLDSFVADARSASRGLQKFGGRVGGVVDLIVSINEQALLLLEETAKDVQPQLYGDLVQRTWKIMFPAKPISTEALETRMKVLKAVWLEATRKMKSMVEGLIHEARLNMDALDRLEAKLTTINAIVVREDNRITEDKEELVCHTG